MGHKLVFCITLICEVSSSTTDKKYLAKFFFKDKVCFHFDPNPSFALPDVSFEQLSFK